MLNFKHFTGMSHRHGLCGLLSVLFTAPPLVLCAGLHNSNAVDMFGLLTALCLHTRLSSFRLVMHWYAQSRFGSEHRFVSAGHNVCGGH
jgi:hypothetical protein